MDATDCTMTVRFGPFIPECKIGDDVLITFPDWSSQSIGTVKRVQRSEEFGLTITLDNGRKLRIQFEEESIDAGTSNP